MICETYFYKFPEFWKLERKIRKLNGLMKIWIFEDLKIRRFKYQIFDTLTTKANVMHSFTFR